MKAVIISSGDGTRLRPVTCSVPHCMLPVMGRPVIEHTTKILYRYNIKNIGIMSTYLTDEIKKHFSLLETSVEFYPPESLAQLIEKDDLLLISDSIITDIDLEELISVHNHSGSDATVVLSHCSRTFHYGIFCTDKDGFASAYNPFCDFTQVIGTPFMGIAVIKKGTNLNDVKSLPVLCEKLLKNKYSVYCHTTSSYIADISDFDSYRKCCRDFMDKKIRLPFPCEEKAPSVWIDDGATVMQGAIITPPVYIGKDSFVNKGARVEAYSQILRNVTLNCHSDIKRSIVMDNTYISEGVSLRGAILGENCFIGEDCAAYEGSVVGFGTKLGNRCTVRTSVHVWPDKFIEDGTVINNNITWENTTRNTLLFPGKAEGILNRELSPEFAVALGRTLTHLIGKKIAVSCEDDGAGLMLKNALVSGIQSGGGKAYDMGEQPLPITRSAVRFYALDGAVSMSVRQDKLPAFATLDIINSDGINLDRSTTEKLGQIMKDVPAGNWSQLKISSPEFLYEYKLYYLKRLINSTSGKPLGKNILIHAPSVWAKELLKSAAKDLRCNFVFTDISDKDAFGKKLTEGKFDFGAICDYRCETLTLIAKDGYVLSEFDYCVMTSLLIMKIFPSSIICVPESCPDNIDSLAKKYKAKIIRTSLNPPHLMTELSKSNNKMFLYQFVFRFDAVGSIIILLDLLHENTLTIEELLSEIPPAETFTTEIDLPRENQSLAFKHLYTLRKTEIPQTEDSVRINFENGWVMIVGDKDRSLLKIISHSHDKEYAREIADICIDDIADI